MPHGILQSKLASTDMRYVTFYYALKLLKQKSLPTCVETGTARNGRNYYRGEGCSTIIFAEWIKIHGGFLYSVDIDPLAVSNCQYSLEELAPYVQITCQDSVLFLQNFSKTIDFLCLDSYDNMIYENLKSYQEHNLREIIAAYPHLADDCIVMIDGNGMPPYNQGFAIKFLLQKEWKIISQHYQTLLARKDICDSKIHCFF